MRISDWSSDVCSSDLGEVAEVVDGERDVGGEGLAHRLAVLPRLGHGDLLEVGLHAVGDLVQNDRALGGRRALPRLECLPRDLHGAVDVFDGAAPARSEEHTSELQSLMRSSYAVFCLEK